MILAELYVLRMNKLSSAKEGVVLLEQMSVYSEKDLSELVSIINSKNVYAENITDTCNRNGKYCFVFDKEYFQTVSGYIALWINKERGVQKIIDMVLSLHGVIDDNDRSEVCCCAIQKLKKDTSVLVEILKCKLKDLSEIDNYIYLDGFMNFCLGEYTEEIELIMEEALEEYFIKKEYADFLDLLHYFADVEERGFGKLDIITTNDGKYRFYDESRIDITDSCVRIFNREFNDQNITENDFLISILILLLPEEISIYGAENIINKNILKTLKFIFENRIYIYDTELDK